MHVDLDVEMNQIMGSFDVVDLNDKSPQSKKKGLAKGLSASGLTRSYEKGSNQFFDAKGEVAFTPTFEDEDKQHVLVMHCLRSKSVSNSLVSNVLYPVDLEKMDGMTFSELNQFVGNGQYRVVFLT